MGSVHLTCIEIETLGCKLCLSIE